MVVCCTVLVGYYFSMDILLHRQGYLGGGDHGNPRFLLAHPWSANEGTEVSSQQETKPICWRLTCRFLPVLSYFRFLQHEFLYSNMDIGTYPIDIELLVDRTPTADGTRGKSTAAEKPAAQLCRNAGYIFKILWQRKAKVRKGWAREAPRRVELERDERMRLFLSSYALHHIFHAENLCPQVPTVFVWLIWAKIEYTGFLIISERMIPWKPWYFLHRFRI